MFVPVSGDDPSITLLIEKRKMSKQIHVAKQFWEKGFSVQNNNNNTSDNKVVEKDGLVDWRVTGHTNNIMASVQRYRSRVHVLV